MMRRSRVVGKRDKLCQQGTDEIQNGEYPNDALIANGADKQTNNRRPYEHGQARAQIQNGDRCALVFFYQ